MSGAKLYLGGATGITIDGNKASAPPDSGPIIEMFDDNSIVSVGAGAVLRDNINRVSNGGAIRAVPGTVIVGGAGASIRDNEADNGGGISNTSGSIVINSGATISGNKADSNGGGISSASGSIAINSGATISGNTAGSNGGGIFTQRVNLGNLTVAASTTFSGNSAGAGGVANYAVTDAGLYASHIFGILWSSSYTQGYNNFDIGYRGPLPNHNPTSVRERLLRARNRYDNSVVWCSSTTDYCKCLNSGR
ncbi:MAG: hypothetical protein LBK46_01745 [Oscillospiraceae bacterium]|nr:hypothetical protein [Oscillospiraceae bacterium]